MASEPSRTDLRIALLTVFVAPHKLPIYEALAQRVKRLSVLVSTPMDKDRDWQPEHGEVEVIVQKTSTLETQRHHKIGFRDRMFVHVPWDTIKLLRHLSPDVIISHEFGFRTFFSGLYTTFIARRTPLIIWAALSEHTEKGKGILRWCFRKLLLRMADVVVVNGSSGATYLRKMGLPEHRLMRFPYATIPTRFDNFPPTRGPETRRRLVFSGRLIDLKGIEQLLEAVARWGTKNQSEKVELTLVGDGPARKRIEAIPLPPNVTLRITGHCDYSGVVDELERAGVFVFPSLSDDWGMAVNEAMQAGLPVLGSVYSQAVHDMIVEGKNGWRFHTNVPEEFDRALAAALATPHSELVTMGEQARHRIEHRTPDYSAEHLLRAVAVALKYRGQEVPLPESAFEMAEASR